MALPISVTYTFATATGTIPLSQLDDNFTTVVNAINGIGNGTNSLSNVSITGGTANLTSALQVAGKQAVNGPAFLVTKTNDQTITADATAAKLTFNTKIFDTATAFSTSTYRFTPLIEGYYQFSWGLFNSTAGVTRLQSSIVKNGTTTYYGSDVLATQSYLSAGSILLYMNGSTDYVEVYGYCKGANAAIKNTSYFSGSMVRGA